MGWLFRYNASSEIIRKHINMMHHQEINELKVGGPNLQSKEQIGRIFLNCQNLLVEHQI